ncbi:MAG: methylmalonyl Co-A mutase-associated GTPase MeaB [Flavobacteriaceae bacterium]
MSQIAIDIDQLKTAILLGDRAALSRGITLCESSLPVHRKASLALLEALLPSTGNAIRIGVSGIPGAGKSTLIEALGLNIIRNHHKKVAVLAVDPSSQQNKGSILGDKTRMEQLSQSQEAFIRPSPSNTTLGGVGEFSYETILLCEAAGYEVILLETVGVGQSETAVNQLTDVFILLQIVGAGDDIQAIKRGVLEHIDILVMNKADTGLEKQAEQEAANLKKSLHLFPSKHQGWERQVLTCSATENKGISTLWKTIEEHQKHLKSTQGFKNQRFDQQKSWYRRLAQHTLNHHIFNHEVVKTINNTFFTALEKEGANPFELLTGMGDALDDLFKG